MNEKFQTYYIIINYKISYINFYNHYNQDIIIKLFYIKI